MFSKTAQGRPLHRCAAAIGNILANGDAIAQEMIVTRCTRGADIARSLRFPEAVCDGIYRLDEHWDGSGRPGRLRGESIPLPARIALLAQVIDVFHSHAGREAAIEEAARRAGGWFDPGLVAAFERVAREHSFWTALSSPFLEARVVGLVPAGDDCAIDEDYLDAIAAAFGQVIDAKSPYTAGHSGRVAELSAMIAGHLDVPADRLRWLRRAAFLHDVGKLGVSNAILDKPAGLDTEEWAEMRAHAAHTAKSSAGSACSSTSPILPRRIMSGSTAPAIRSDSRPARLRAKHGSSRPATFYDALTVRSALSRRAADRRGTAAS